MFTTRIANEKFAEWVMGISGNLCVAAIIAPAANLLSIPEGTPGWVITLVQVAPIIFAAGGAACGLVGLKVYETIGDR